MFWVHGQHCDVAATKHLLMHVQLTNDGPDALLLHHGLWQRHKVSTLLLWVSAGVRGRTPADQSSCQIHGLRESPSDFHFIIMLPLAAHVAVLTLSGWEVQNLKSIFAFFLTVGFRLRQITNEEKSSYRSYQYADFFVCFWLQFSDKTYWHANFQTTHNQNVIDKKYSPPQWLLQHL